MKNDFDKDILDFDLDREVVDIYEFNAPIWKRLVHIILDSFIFFWIAIIGLVITFPNRESGPANNTEVLFFFIFFFSCWFAFEFAFGKTLGKLITQSKVVMKDGRKPTFIAVFIRTITRLIPFGFLSFFGTKKLTIHDYISNTRVVSVKYKY